MEILLNWRRAVDFLVLCGTFYVVLLWASRARALRIALAIIGLYSSVLIARQFDLVITTWILQGAALIAVGLLVIVFQPEVRRALMRLDRTFLTTPRGSTTGDAARIIADTAFELAAARVGALFVILRKDPVEELIQGGTVLGADVSNLLIHAIFQKSSPLHDGAMIVEGGRIQRAGAVLPLTLREDIPPEFGTRHRAAMGLAERSDAVVLAVSEERGEVTAMRARTYLRMESPTELAQLIGNPATRQKTTLAARARALVVKNWRFKLAAVGLASLIWTIAIFDSSSAVRTVDVPIEFQNVPRGMDITDQSVTDLEVQLAGRRWLMDTNQISGLIARFDLRGMKEGRQKLHVVPSALSLPPGINVKRVRPETIEVRLVKHTRRPGGSSTNPLWGTTFIPRRASARHCPGRLDPKRRALPARFDSRL